MLFRSAVGDGDGDSVGDSDGVAVGDGDGDSVGDGDGVAAGDGDGDSVRKVRSRTFRTRRFPLSEM